MEHLTIYHLPFTITSCDILLHVVHVIGTLVRNIYHYTYTYQLCP